MDPPDPTPEERRRLSEDSFKALVDSSPPPVSEVQTSSFVRQATASCIQIMAVASRMKALALSEKGLIGQFIGIWPFPKTMEYWISKNWMPLISRGL